MRVDEAGDRGLPAPVDDDVARPRRLAVLPREVRVGPDPRDEAVLGNERRILDPGDPSLVGARSCGTPQGSRELGEVPDDEAAQTASPSFRLGLMTETE